MQNADYETANDERNRPQIEHERRDHRENARKENTKTDQLFGAIVLFANSTD